MNSLIVKTTFKNNLQFFLPFYKFYKEVWNPETFVFIIGYTDTEENEIAKISSLMKHRPHFVKKFGSMEHAKYINLWEHENIKYIFYNTDEKYSSPVIWDCLKGKLFALIRKTVNPREKKELSIDNDDFFYVKDSLKATMNEKLYFHALEFLPQKVFSKENNFQFVSSRYFYMHKGSGNSLQKNHDLCSVVDWPWNENVGHACNRFPELPGMCKKNIKVCGLSEGLNQRKLEEMDGFSFSFGCLDLEYLLNVKHWLQSTIKDDRIKMRHSLDDIQIKEEFFKNYSLTDKEMKENIIIQIEDFKRFFFTD